jgi:uncharacterized RDD family membrane protein YckC
MEKQMPISSGTRLGSMMLDHIFMLVIAVVFFLPVLIGSMSGIFDISHEQTNSFNFKGTSLYIGLIGFAFYFCKDSVNGRSLAKRITKLQLVDNVTGSIASPLQCLTRNIFCIIWPVEVIVALSNPNRRLGDLVAGTKLVWYDPENTVQSKTDYKKIVLPLMIAYLLLLLIIIPLQNIPSSSNGMKYVRTSYNQKESVAIEQMYVSDGLKQYLTVSAMVYDSVENSKLKYISVIYLFNKNYFDYPGKVNELELQTLQLLYTRYPENTFTGNVQYIYKEEGNMSNYNHQIGVKVKTKN